MSSLAARLLACARQDVPDSRWGLNTGQIPALDPTREPSDPDAVDETKV